MSKRLRTTVLAMAGATALALPLLVTDTATVAHAVNPTALTDEQDDLLSGFLSFELGEGSSSNSNSSSRTVANYQPRGSQDCGFVNSSNVKVNQNCLNLSDQDLAGRGQAQNETSIAQDPNNPNHMIATYNDYRRGDGTCGSSYSLDKGRTWNDSTVPDNFTRGTADTNAGTGFKASREYWQAGGDTSVSWDSKGNAYLSCQLFNRGTPASTSRDQSSALVVFRSTQNNGASWNFPGRYVQVRNNVGGNQLPLLDKQLMTVDSNPTSCATFSAGSSCTPFQDRVYVTWTEFAANGTAYIYEAYSADYAEHFSAPHLVSASAAVCTNTYPPTPTPNGSCNENQDSQPFVGPDGSLYVAFNNYNNPLANAQDNRNQILLAKSTDGGETFTAPVKVGDYYDLPDCATYQAGQDFGRACVPEKNGTANSIFRATNYPSGAVNPTNPRQVVVSYGSYINHHSNEANGCVPAAFAPDGNNAYTGVKTPGACNNDIVYSVSGDGGATFTGTTADVRAMPVVTQDPGQATTDQFWQWESFTKNGKLAVSYYDRQYGTDEATGYSDVSLSGTGDLARFATTRVTSSSMPFPTEFSGLFYGDYAGLSAVDNAYPLWADTRNPELFACGNAPTSITTPPAVCLGAYPDGTVANDQDAYTASLPVPSK